MSVRTDTALASPRLNAAVLSSDFALRACQSHLSKALAAEDQCFRHYGNAAMTKKAFSAGYRGVDPAAYLLTVCR